MSREAETTEKVPFLKVWTDLKNDFDRDYDLFGVEEI